MKAAIFLTAGLLAMTLAGCSSTDTPDGYTRVETWTSSWGPDGKKISEDHTVGYKKNPDYVQGAEYDGIWTLQDGRYAGTNKAYCLFELTSDKSGADTFGVRVNTHQCAAELLNVANWKPVALGGIGFYDASGKQIGDFRRTSHDGDPPRYNGEFTLAKGQVVKALLSRF